MATQETHRELNRLIERYQDGTATPAERTFVEQYYAWFDGEPRLSDELTKRERRQWLANGLAGIHGARPAKVMPLFRKIVRVAAVLIVLAGAGYWFLLRNSKAPAPVTTAAMHVPAPDRNKAIIVLGNGDSVNLDQLPGNRFVTPEGVVVTRTGDGEIRYSAQPATVGIVYNTAINPRGSTKMHIGLPDGTDIWLNAGSSIRYPLVFTEATRKVTLDGEAYLEVAHDAKRPFVVEKGSTRVTVLGTHFNVKAYDNDAAIRITLLEGSVRVQNDNATQLLKPNEQAVVKDNGIQWIPDADTNEALAWMNGRTSFHDIGLAEAFKELERWYNVTIITAEGAKLPAKSLYMDIDRNLPLQSVLTSVLEVNGVQYRYEAEIRTIRIQ